MALVLALLLTTLWGVHAASIPTNSLDILASKSDNKLEKQDTPNLDKIRRGVLEDMKRLLDSQLGALFENAVTRKAGSQRKHLKSKTKSHPTIRTGETTPDFESIIPDEEPRNSELIKVLTDDSLQDPNDELLRDAVDQLLKKDEGRADNIDNSEAYNNENQLNGGKSTKNNSEEFSGDDAFDDATLPINTTGNDRKKGKSNKKGISHVIIEHITESNKNDDDEKNVEDILDLDKILKSALKDYSGSLSQEDENSMDEKNEGDLGISTHYAKSSHEKEQLFTNDSETELRIHDPEENRFQFDGNNNVDFDENMLRTEKPVENNIDNDHIPNLTNNDNYKKNHHQIYQHRKQTKGRQPINHNISDENRTLILDDINREGNDFNKDNNDTKYLKLEENEVKKEHKKRQRPYKKTKNRYGKKHANKNRHSKRRSRNHDKHKHHIENKTHDHEATGHHLIVRLISDSDGSNESKLDTMHNTPTHKKTTHSVSSDLREGRQDIKKNIYNRDSYDSSESIKNDSNKENASQDDNEDKINRTKIENPNSKEEENNFMERDNITVENDSASKDKFNKRKTEDLSEIDDEQLPREGNKNTVETVRSKEEKNIDYEDKILIENEGSVDVIENDAINRTEKDPSEKNKASKEIYVTEIKTNISDKEDSASDEEEIGAEKHNAPKKDETHRCHHEHENDEANLIHDLLQNKEMKKSYSLSLTLSTK